jgi:hypothetical protein
MIKPLHDNKLARFFWLLLPFLGLYIAVAQTPLPPQLAGREALLWELQNNPNVVAFGVGENAMQTVFVLQPDTHFLSGLEVNNQVVVSQPFVFEDQPAPPADLNIYSYLPSISNASQPLQALCRDRADACRPVLAGISVGKNMTGTQGPKVYDRTTGEPLGLSNAHVYTRNGKYKCCDGDDIVQPGLADGCPLDDCRVGDLLRWTPVDPDINETIYADAAVFRPWDGITISDQVWGLGVINSNQEAYVGMHVCKSGLTTGVSCGTVAYVDVCVQIQGSNRLYLFCDQNLVTYDDGPGDSGSIVVVNDGVYNKATGLNFAGGDYAIFNDIQEVLDRLNITFTHP